MTIYHWTVSEYNLTLKIILSFNLLKAQRLTDTSTSESKQIPDNFCLCP